MRICDMQLGLGHLDACRPAQPITTNQGGYELRHVGNSGVHRTRRSYLAALIVLLRLPLIVPTIGEIASKIAAPCKAGTLHAKPVEIGLGQTSHIKAEPLRLASVLNNEL